MYLKRRGKVWVWALMAGCLVAVLALPLGVGAQGGPYEGGDAPSSHNHGGATSAPWPPPIVMETYPGSGVKANFPVVWDYDGTLGPGPGGGAYPAGYYAFCHPMPPRLASYLGIGPSGELDADMLPDLDPVTNIDPPTNTANRDAFDDGATIPTLLPHCGTAIVTITGQSNPLPGENLYLNAWFDWNRDGDWEDGSVCGCGDNEWAIQDQTVGPGPFTLNIPIVPCHTTVPYDPLWARVTLSYWLGGLGEPYAYGGSAIWLGGGCLPDGETEDYFVQPQQPAFDLGDLVWWDTDQDGLQDAGEPGVQGILATLYPNGASTGRSLATDTTDANGNYLFTNLPYGTYCLEFSNIPANWAITLQNQGVDDTVDSDADPATGQIQNVLLVADDYDEDMGLYVHGSLGDQVWYDTDQDGLQDAGEPGVQGILATLYPNGTCTAPSLATDTSDANGNYLFTSVPAGTYCLEFSNILAGWSITLRDQGADDTVDSDADPATGRIENIVLAANDPDQDMGLYVDGSIGDQVWCDTNGNGVYDPGEGVDDITVWLYSDPDCDGDEADGLLLGTQETADGGLYSFTDLNTGPPGSTTEVCYVVVVDSTDPGLGACNVPLTAVRFGILLDALDPDTGAADFGFTGQPVAAFVPEWGTLALLGSGLVGLAGYASLRWRKK